MKDYCKQNDGNCFSCSLNNYGRDCYNNPIWTDIQIQIPTGKWERFESQAQESGFTGEEYLMLLALCVGETDFDGGIFEEMEDVPLWAIERLKEKRWKIEK